jgi:hypothetical protein
MSENQVIPPMYCYNHPQRETLLRCNRCERPICSECAILTPTGYRCKECVRGQQKVFETTQGIDFPIAAVTAGVISFAGSYIASYMGFFTIFIAPIAGVLISEAVRKLVHRRRSRLLFQITALAAVIGSLPLLVVYASSYISYPVPFTIYRILPLIWQGLYTVLIGSSVYYRLSGYKV